MIIYIGDLVDKFSLATKGATWEQGGTGGGERRGDVRNGPLELVWLLNASGLVSLGAASFVLYNN